MLYCFEDYVFDTGRRELRRGATALAVEPQVFDLIAYLIENRERVVSRDELREAVWAGRIVSESAMNTAINAARTAIGDNGEDQRLIRTLPRKGLRFVGPVREQEPAPATAAGGSSGEPVPAMPEQNHSPIVGPAAGRPPAVVTPRRAVLLRPTLLVVSFAAVAAIAATPTYLLWFASNTSQAPSAAAPSQRFNASSVPLVEDETRRSLASYPNRPDAKALAITSGGMAVAEGQPTAEAAKQDALQRCTARTGKQCRIYAVGMEVVWSKEALPLPAPEDLRYEPLEAPLVPEEIPTLDRPRREAIARRHMRAQPHKALALATGAAWTIPAKGTRAEAARLALERCAERWQRPCLLLSVDGMLTIRIPRSRRAIRIFLPSVEADLSAGDRKRIGQVYQGPEWRALARGKNGTWHAVADAPSEAAAIETALKSCGEADTECRLYAIGNFRVADE